MESRIKIEVRSTQIDAMAHVNNATFLEYMEWGREDWYEKIGVDFPGLEKRGLGTVVVNINIDYYKEVFQGDILEILTVPVKRGNKSFVLRHEIYNSTGEKIAAADVTSLIVDLEERKSVELVNEIADCYL